MEAVKVKKSWGRYFNKQLVAVLVSGLLAAASVYLIGPWVSYVTDLEKLPMFLNFGVAIMTGITYFIAKTYFDKGSMNKLRKIGLVVLFSLGTVGMALLSMGSVGDIVYPISGIFIISVTFYMVSLSSQTLGMLGMVFLSIVMGTLVAGGWMFGYISGDWVLTLSKIAMLIILAIGGVFAQIRMYLHGIRGVNNDGGFGRTDPTEDGNNGDGNGDAEGEG